MTNHNLKFLTTCGSLPCLWIDMIPLDKLHTLLQDPFGNHRDNLVDTHPQRMQFQIWLSIHFHKTNTQTVPLLADTCQNHNWYRFHFHHCIFDPQSSVVYSHRWCRHLQLSWYPPHLGSGDILCKPILQNQSCRNRWHTWCKLFQPHCSRFPADRGHIDHQRRPVQTHICSWCQTGLSWGQEESKEVYHQHQPEEKIGELEKVMVGYLLLVTSFSQNKLISWYMVRNDTDCDTRKQTWLLQL